MEEMMLRSIHGINQKQTEALEENEEKWWKRNASCARLLRPAPRCSFVNVEELRGVLVRSSSR